MISMGASIENKAYEAYRPKGVSCCALWLIVRDARDIVERDGGLAGSEKRGTLVGVRRGSF